MIKKVINGKNDIPPNHEIFDFPNNFCCSLHTVISTQNGIGLTRAKKGMHAKDKKQTVAGKKQKKTNPAEKREKSMEEDERGRKEGRMKLAKLDKKGKRGGRRQVQVD